MTDDKLSDRVTFRAGEASALGISRYRLSTLKTRRLTRGVYAASADDLGLQTRAKAVMHACGPKLVFSHHTAARLLGGIVPEVSQIHVTTTGRRIQRIGVTAHRSRRPIPVTRKHGLPFTSGVRTFLDLAGHLDLIDLVVLGDSLVKSAATTPQELQAEAATWRGTGVGLARRAATLVREHVDSPTESRLRLLIILAGLPEPTVRVLVPVPGGNPYRLDLGYPDHQLGIEYDGRHHAESDAQWAHDLRRREFFDGCGWRIVVVNGSDLWNKPAGVLDRIVSAGRARGMTMPDPNPQWRQYFRSTQR